MTHRSSTLLIRNADLLVTMDKDRREIVNGGLFARAGVIEQVGDSDELAYMMQIEAIDLKGHIVLPGLINTHHHLFQTLTRAVPTAQNGSAI